MKKNIKLFFVTFVALALLSSCVEKEANHIFTTRYEGLMENTDEGKARYEMVCSYITSIDPSYFGQNHSYFGLSFDADTAAWMDFTVACDKIDTVMAKSFLSGGEQIRVDLVETADNAYRIVGAYLIYKEAEAEAEKKESE